MKAVNVSLVNENLLSAGCGSAVTESLFIQPRIKHTRLEFPQPPSASLSFSPHAPLRVIQLNTTCVHTAVHYDWRCVFNVVLIEKLLSLQGKPGPAGLPGKAVSISGCAVCRIFS